MRWASRIIGVGGSMFMTISYLQPDTMMRRAGLLVFGAINVLNKQIH